ncbi:hypothetical protein AB0J83_09885 [Actinoplanes sp. NPDC049596]|uniref:hypothetical protein n=1 Tax=unclassified Actinoplanes TaxID=2626549 RepID=UPI00342452AA
MAILPGLIATLIAFFVASRVESLGLSASDKIAASVEQRLMSSVVLPQYENRMQIARTDLAALSEPDASGYLAQAHTLKMMFLYERFWGDVYGRRLRDWLERDDEARIFIYLPQTTTALMTALSARHGTDVPGFTGRVRDVPRKLDEALGAGPGRPDLRHRVRYGVVPAPGPSYSGYVFDSRKYDSHGRRLAGDLHVPVTVRVIARMYATSNMGSHSELPTFFAADGPFADFVRRDVDAIHDRQAGSLT